MTKHLDEAERLWGLTFQNAKNAADSGDYHNAIHSLCWCIEKLRELSASPGDGDAKEPSPPERGFCMLHAATPTKWPMAPCTCPSPPEPASDRPYMPDGDGVMYWPSRAPVVSKMEIAEPASEGEPSDDELEDLADSFCPNLAPVDIEERLKFFTIVRKDACRALYNRGVRDGERKAK